MKSLLGFAGCAFIVAAAFVQESVRRDAIPYLPIDMRSDNASRFYLYRHVVNRTVPVGIQIRYLVSGMFLSIALAIFALYALAVGDHIGTWLAV